MGNDLQKIRSADGDRARRRHRHRQRRVFQSREGPHRDRRQPAACCIFFCAAAVVSHGRDVLAYLSVFAVIMALSIPFYRPEAKTQ